MQYAVYQRFACWASFLYFYRKHYSMKKAIITVFSLIAMACGTDALAIKKVDARYLEQVTISGHKLHIQVIDTKEDGTEEIVASGIVYTHVKKDELAGAKYGGDSFVTDANSPNNLVAVIKKEGVYDLYQMQRDKTIAKHIEK